MSSRRLGKAFIYVLLCVYAFICIYPILWMIGASLKAPVEVLNGLNIFPEHKWHWGTYKDVWERLHFFKYFLNSVNVAVWTLVGIVVLFTMAAFAIAKLNFRGRDLLFYSYIGMMFVPGITILIPLYLTENYLGILNTHLGLILPMVNGAAPASVFLFRNYFRMIPHEIYESAKIEGASIIRILWQIYFPLSLPAVATICILNFMGIWNTLLLPMVMLTKQSLYTLPLAVMLLDTGVFRQWNVIMAGSLISVVPAVIVFYSLQKYYIQGMSAGAIR